MPGNIVVDSACYPLWMVGAGIAIGSIVLAGVLVLLYEWGRSR